MKFALTDFSFQNESTVNLCSNFFQSLWTDIFCVTNLQLQIPFQDTRTTFCDAQASEQLDRVVVETFLLGFQFRSRFEIFAEFNTTAYYKTRQMVPCKYVFWMRTIFAFMHEKLRAPKKTTRTVKNNWKFILQEVTNVIFGSLRNLHFRYICLCNK